MKKFPSDFIWGAATASYQVEGAAGEDGRGETIWDRYCRIPGNVMNGDSGDIACDHYHRYKEDVTLMKKMGLKAYRFSIAWSRVLPKGRKIADAADEGINRKGLAFYSDLVDELLAAGITPYVTLYHWDLPQALQDIGGWANEEMPRYFLEYSSLLFQTLGDRVRHWITLNEPYCVAFLGNYEGRMAPGLHDFSTALRVAYYQYLGHGLVVKHFRESSMKGEIGIVLNLMGRLPLSDSAEDLEAAKRADGYLNRWFLDPLIRGTYPQDMIDWYVGQGVVLPEFKKEELELIRQRLDFIGLNYYNDFHVTQDLSKWPVGFKIQNPKYVPVNDRNWPVTEQGFADMLIRMKEEYGIEKIIISENGTSFPDVVSLDHTVEDGARKDYLRRHLLALHQAMEAGVQVTGYFLWSLYDNFEWSNGYSSRFGIVFVDFATGERIVKESGHWFSGVIARNGVE